MIDIKSPFTAKKYEIALLKAYPLMKKEQAGTVAMFAVNGHKPIKYINGRVIVNRDGRDSVAILSDGEVA